MQDANLFQGLDPVHPWHVLIQDDQVWRRPRAEALQGLFAAENGLDLETSGFTECPLSQFTNVLIVIHQQHLQRSQGGGLCHGRCLQLVEAGLLPLVAENLLSPGHGTPSERVMMRLKSI